MLKEQVMKIKEAEEKAEKIIKDGEKKAAEIIRSIDDKLEEFAKIQQGIISKALAEYSNLKDKERDALMESIKREAEEKLSDLKKEMREKVDFAAEKVWNELQKKFFRK
ncbi:MAG TPA: hypothetical protein PKN36_02125 [bacterium]|nr:hypothetical protein [bacterium]